MWETLTCDLTRTVRQQLAAAGCDETADLTCECAANGACATRSDHVSSENLTVLRLHPIIKLIPLYERACL